MLAAKVYFGNIRVKPKVTEAGSESILVTVAKTRIPYIPCYFSECADYRILPKWSIILDDFSNKQWFSICSDIISAEFNCFLCTRFRTESAFYAMPVILRVGLAENGELFKKCWILFSRLSYLRGRVWARKFPDR